jgi:hypothetical protein
MKGQPGRSIPGEGVGHQLHQGSQQYLQLLQAVEQAITHRSLALYQVVKIVCSKDGQTQQPVI